MTEHEMTEFDKLMIEELEKLKNEIEESRNQKWDADSETTFYRSAYNDAIYKAYDILDNRIKEIKEVTKNQNVILRKENQMIITDLMEYVGENVRVYFTKATADYEGEYKEGKLGYVRSFSAEFGYRKPHYFYIDNLNFKAYHIRKVERIYK